MGTSPSWLIRIGRRRYGEYGGIYGRIYMVFADGIEQPCLAAVFEHRCMHFSPIHFDAVPAEFLHQALEDLRAGHVDLVQADGA